MNGVESVTTTTSSTWIEKAKKGGEILQLLFLNFRVTVRNLGEFVRVAYRYYRNTRFAKADLLLLSQYVFHNPYRISRAHLQKTGAEDVYTYGETPLTTLESIAKECGITERDTVVELGAGRGRSCLWLRYFVKCKVIGIEWLPAFVQKAQYVIQKCDIKGVEFLQEDMLTADLSDVSEVYLYGTCMSDEDIRVLLERLQSLTPGTKVITVSYPLTDYGDGFEVLRRFPARFTWGDADVYLHARKRS